MKITKIKTIAKSYRINIKASFAIHTLFVLIVFIACDTNQSTKLEQALRLSGENRAELERVISHYSRREADSLKLKAAYFLIENMPGHYTLRGEIIDKCREKIENDTLNSYFQKKLINIVLSHFIHDESSYKVEDIQNIKADYLIHHIDLSFEILETYSWLDIIPFEIFLEYTLPYRFNDEPIDNWRDSLTIATHKDMKSKKVQGYFKNKCTDLLPYLNIKEKTDYHYKLALDVLNTNLNNDCYCIAYKQLLEQRVLGIPCIMHFIPLYSNRNGYHYWVLDPPIINKETNIMGALDRRTAKVFKHTFSRNNAITNNDEYIPELFKNPFIVDITNDYLYANKIEININTQAKIDSKYGYLCVFNDLCWKAIAIGEIKNKTADFDNIGKNIVYLPVYFKEEYDMKPLNYPFIMKSNNKIHYLVPDTCAKQTLQIYRKNPMIHDLNYFYRTLDGMIIEASNDYKFKKADTLFVLKDSNEIETFVFQLKNNNHNKYRWYRVCADFTKNISYLAEMYFYDDNGNILHGKIDPKYEAIFDGDPLTNITMQKSSSFIIDFKKPIHISRLTCIPRNDGNGIYPHNLYELLYWNGNGWKSLGVKTTKELFIEYENAPTNALFWLHNITTGCEERIFTYENRIVHFW